MSAVVQYFWELDVYKEAFDLQQRVFRLSRSWPKQESYALLDQVGGVRVQWVRTLPKHGPSADTLRISFPS
jgi:hypothetical protein